jgi:hypothetical protein
MDQKIDQEMKLQAALISSDWHDCSDADLELLAGLAKHFSCNVHLNAGDVPDERLGHPLFSDMQNYFLLTSKNQSLNPADYSLPENWHLLTEGFEKNGVIVPPNNFLHFHYWLDTTVPGIGSGERMYSFLVIHDPIMSKLISTTIKKIQDESEDCYFLELSEVTREKAKQIAEMHHQQWGVNESCWPDVGVFGHFHRWVNFSWKGVKIIDPGPWGENRLCASIIVPGPVCLLEISLTEDFIQVVNPEDLARRLKSLIVV